MKHEHKECEHKRLAYCKVCKVVYCEDCSKEWADYPSVWTWKCNYEYPTTTIWPEPTTTISVFNANMHEHTPS